MLWCNGGVVVLRCCCVDTCHHVTTSTSLLHHLTTTYLNTSTSHHITTLNNLFNLLCDIVEALRRFESSHYHSALVDEELCEVPLYVGCLLIVGRILGEHLLEHRSELVCRVEACERLLLLEELEEVVGVVAVHLHLLEARELGVVRELAELVYRLVGTGGLCAELVAREVEHLESLRMILLVELLQLLVLRCEAALYGCVYDEQHFVGILLEGNILSLSVFNRKFVNSSHFFYLYVCVIYISDLNLYDLECKDTTFLLEYFNSFFKNSKNRTKS